MSTSVIPGGLNRAALIVPAIAVCILALPARAAESASAEAQPAVWTQKELTFVYQGFTTRYSCDGLRDKVWSVLLDLGARKNDLKVMQLGCSSHAGGPDPFPGVRVKMSVLQPVTGNDDKQKPVMAHWKSVDLKLDSFSTDSGDCELVEQIRQTFLPQFATRNVESRTDCIPHQATAGQPSLKLEVLAADDARSPAGEPRTPR